MKKTILLASSLALAALNAPSFAETAEQRNDRMAWWREARFGMFVHWGLYSGLAGTWDGKPVGTRGGMEWIQNSVKADTKTYADKALPLFKPKPGFAKEWAALAKQAGCRYIVFTTKHHEGFGLYSSKAGDYNAGARLQRDLVREIVEAARDQGLKVGFYHSVIDWHHDQYEYNRSKQLPHPLRGKPYPEGARDHAKYKAYLHQQVDELMSNYGPVDVLWWDYSATDFQGDAAWDATALMDLVRAKQPKIIMNNRLFRTPEAGWKSMGTDGYANTLDPKYGDFVTPEQHIPATGMPGVDWETCMTMNTTWGYSDHDHAWKSSATMLRNLCDIASKGGNYLLNIGPKGDGSVPEPSVKALKDIGAWMAKYGDSIWKTGPSPFAKLPYDGRCTVTTSGKGASRLNLLVYTWPADGRLAVPVKADRIRSARIAGSTKKLPVTAEGDQAILTVPAKAPDATVSVVHVELAN